jgi:hypothetical protein
MRILTAGFNRDTSDQIGDWLREGAHEVLGATGRSSSRTLARVARPDAVVIPAEGAGAKAKEWLEDLLSDVPVLVLTTHLAAKEALLAALQVTFNGDASLVQDVASPASNSAEQDDRAVASDWQTRNEILPSRTSSVDEGLPDGEHTEAEVAEPMSGLEVEAAEPAGDVVPAVPHQPANSTLAHKPPLSGANLEANSRELSVAQPSLDAKLEAVRFADYYAILEAEPGASTFEIRQQFEALTAIYIPSGWPTPLGAEALPKLEEIAQGIRDAYTVLGDPGHRERYDSARSESLTVGERSAGRL